MKMTRRHFVKWGTAAMAGLGLSRSHAKTEKNIETMPTRPLGKTGHEVSLFSLGGQGMIERPGQEDEPIAMIHRALDLGVNYVDTAPSYGGGQSETLIGRVMKDRRNETFLASKTHHRTYDGTMMLIESSLRRLQTDRLDLYQLHSVRTQNDLEACFQSDGAIKALEKLRHENVIRFIGITGHRAPEVLRQGIQRYPFDCILMSLNAADSHAVSFQDELLPYAVEKGMGIIAMKVPAHGRLLRPDGITIEQALHYVWTFPVSTSIVGISSMAQLEENVELAKNFRPYPDPVLRRVADATAHFHEEASWFKYHW
ncbi:MAG TPA: aldo/keto reductase [Kiritimatiellia bacterium]|nr:aldo/keto reductase [Kiritimatiellia bacterium]HMO97928.1 aldo/keto reductase [Kiritimatiellia bacterium]HMP95279.1 aldo/keto reductase [Kiritimatiellia bacterium]